MLYRFAKSVVLALLLLPQMTFAQGVFHPFGFPKTVIATGQAEVLGSVHIALSQGVTVADTLIIDVSPLRITNTNASDIKTTIAGNLSVGVITIEAVEGRVRVPVNAGGTTGSIRIDGIRVSVADTNVSSISARLSWAGLNYLSPSDPVIVVDQVKSGLFVDPMADVFRIYANLVVDPNASIVVHEGFKNAFNSSAEFGQDTPTRIRVRVRDFPGGLRMQFPASVTTTDTAATLTTVEGTSIELPRADGSTEVTYNFNGAGNSADAAESFNIPFTVSVQGAVDVLQPTIELSLSPIGAARPSTEQPATNIPRFAENNILALAGSSVTISKTLYWTGVDTSRTNRLSLFNPSTMASNLTLTAFDAAGQVLSGAGINDPVKLTLQANQSLNPLLSEIFGTGATNIATVRVQSTGSETVALGTISAPGALESIALPERGLSNFVIPIVQERARLHLFNPGDSSVSGTITLRSRTGATLGSTTVTLAPMGALSRDVQDLLGVSGEGQLSGSFPTAVVAFESFGNADTNLIAASVPVGVPAQIVPFFATGNGYETDLTLINSSDENVTISAQPFDKNGQALAAAKPIVVASMSEVTNAISSMFPLPGLNVGYIQLQIPSSTAHGPWLHYTPLNGYARIRSGQSASTVLPISAYTQEDGFFLYSGPASAEFQGLAVVNADTRTAAVTFQVLNTDGQVVQTANVSLTAGQVLSKLTSEIFSSPVAVGSVIRITSNVPVISTAISGTIDGVTLRATPLSR